MLLPFQMAKLSIEMAEKRLDSGQCKYSDKIKMITNIFSLIYIYQFGHEVLQSFPSCFVKLVVLSFVKLVYLISIVLPLNAFHLLLLDLGQLSS